MCNRKKACAQADAAKQHLGEWYLPIDGPAAQDVQYVMDEAAIAGIELADVTAVMRFCLMTTAGLMSARASFDVAPLTGRRAGK